MFNFVSDKTKEKPEEAPFLEDVRASDGWQGITTMRDINSLKAEIMTAVARIGGLVTGFERGTFGPRLGMRIHYVVEGVNGKHIPAHIDVASLPVRPRAKFRRGQTQTIEKRQEQSLKMALFNVARIFASYYVLQKLAPGYNPLIPGMIVQDGKTVSQFLTDQYNLPELPMGEMKKDNDGDVIDGEIREVDR